MKKALLALLVIVIAVGAVVGISVISKKHIHSYTLKIIKEADCTHEGLADYICSECGQTYEDVVPVTHKYEEKVVAPTYDEEGYTLHTCTICGDEYKDNTVPKLERPSDDIGGAVLNGLEESYDYTGEPIVPEIIVMLHDQALTVNKDYTIKIENNVEPGEATITVTAMGDLKNELVKTFKINRVGWEEKDGLKYYYNGALATGLTEIGEDKYFFDDKGVMQTGWQQIDGGYYCFDRINGFLMTDCQVDGINVDENGLAETSDYNTYKITTMMTAHKIMLEQTEPTDTMEEKRLKLFNWEMYEHGYHRWRLLSDIYETSPDWEITFANDIFERGSGCCVSDSSAAAFLFREIGYKNIYICHDTSHCWFTVEGKLFDPLFAEAKDFDANYNAEFSDYRQWPVGRRRVDGVSTDVDDE